MPFTSVKALCDLAELQDEFGNGSKCKPARVSLLMGSHRPLIPRDVEIIYERRITYAPNGARAVKRMAEDALSEVPKDERGDDLIMIVDPSDQSTCRVASCVMSLASTIAFCSETATPAMASADVVPQAVYGTMEALATSPTQLKLRMFPAGLNKAVTLESGVWCLGQ